MSIIKFKKDLIKISSSLSKGLKRPLSTMSINCFIPIFILKFFNFLVIGQPMPRNKFISNSGFLKNIPEDSINFSCSYFLSIICTVSSLNPS